MALPPNPLAATVAVSTDLTGSPLQAIKYAIGYTRGEDMTAFLYQWLQGELRESFPAFDSFEDFVEANPDLPDRGDGRKAHYGDGKQPLDDSWAQGWGHAFDATNVLKYLRRIKPGQEQHSKESARWYWRDLVAAGGGKYGKKNQQLATRAMITLRDKLLTADELAWVTS